MMVEKGGGVGPDYVGKSKDGLFECLGPYFSSKLFWNKAGNIFD